MASTTFPLHTSGRPRAALRIGVAAALLGLAAGCGGSPTTDAAPVPQKAASAAVGNIISQASLKPGQAVPRPAQKPVLTLTGKISAANKGDDVVLDLRTIERLGVVQVRMYEPWAKQNMAFRGVWLQDLLAVAGAGSNATRLQITALDDYKAELTMDEVRTGGILVATRAGDGSLIPIDKGGPTRILFMDGVKAGANPDQWVWSLKTIDVR
jgi:hypothetical protein